MTHEEKRVRRKAIAEAVADGMAPREAAQQFGVNICWVYTSCKEYGVKCDGGPGNIAQVNTFAILKALVDGDLYYSEIASKYGITKQRVEQIARRAEMAGWSLALRKRGERRQPKPTENEDVGV